ncbi:MAG: cadherin-like beta sandwich domain-containing protein [Clostridium sp.]|nr:cadherin-like beta sandwich domain-containing protein [Clostridium sp.]
MKRVGQRFVALLVVFASILSFLPIELLNNGQAASAATDTKRVVTVSSGQNPNDIKMHVRKYSSADDKRGTEIKSTINSDDEVIFTETGGDTTTYGIAVDDITLNEDQAKELLQKQYQSDLAKNPNMSLDGLTYQMNVITAENINVTSINQINSSNFGSVGISVENTEKYTNIGSKENWFYRKINNIPFGINKIIYELTATQIKYIYDPNTGNCSPETLNDISGSIKTTTITVKSSDTFFIYNGTQYVNRQVKKLVLDQYVGSLEDFNKDDESIQQSNERPFLYKSIAEPIDGIPLKYEWAVSDALTALNYNFTFDSDLKDMVVYVNGAVQNKVEIGTDTNGKKCIVKGSLQQATGGSYFIVIKVNAKSTENGTYIPKSYSIQISFPTKKVQDDYTIDKAGITKYNYNEDSSVKAYIWKTFEHEIDKNGVSQYTGDITIDSKAYMISLDPTLSRTKDSTAYVLTNSYIKNGENSVRESEIKDGKQFVEFNYGESNVLNLDVYEGTNGSKTGKLLAVYKFRVHVGSSDEFETNLQFNDGDTSTAWLTQLGVPQNKIEPFTPNRTNYNLYLKNTNSLKIALTNGTKEFIKVFYSTSTSGSSFTEFPESISNNGSKEIIITPTDKMKRIKVQAYYSQYSDEDGADTNYKLGREYIFYLADNIKQNENNNITDSNDASLSNIKVKGETLRDSDGNKGFNSEVFDYEVKVDKDKKNALITLTPEDENVKSMVATVIETGTTYDFFSGEEIEVTLNESGTTSLSITVTAQDGTTSKIYNVTIINNTKGGSAVLKNVVLSTGNYIFNPSEYKTKVSVDQSVNKISITPIAEDSKAKVTVDGQRYYNTAITVSISGVQKKEIEIVVTSEDGDSSKTYTLEIKRVTSGDDSDDNSYGKEDDSYYDHDNDLWIDNSKYDEWGTTSDGRVVYYDTKGRQVKDRWILTNNKYYYINKSGYRATGWKIDTDGKTYYLDPQTGEMKTGWIYVNGSTYYLNPRGIMQKGWLNLNNKWYYFTANGQMVANTSMYIDERLYRFTQDGVMYY